MGKIIGTDISYYPSLSGEEIETTIVLVMGEIDDYAAYIGHGPAEWVASHGDKLSFAQANCYFAGLKKDRYRL